MEDVLTPGCSMLILMLMHMAAASAMSLPPRSLRCALACVACPTIVNTKPQGCISPPTAVQPAILVVVCYYCRFPGHIVPHQRSRV